MSRAVALIDMDCFYVQVEQRENKTLRGKPCAVVQGTGLLIAVSYEARDLGVTRGHRVKDAKTICPDIQLVNVPEPRGKPDLTRYRDAGAEVITTLSQFARCVVERASIDEAYVDMTEEVNARIIAMETDDITADQLPNTFVVGWEAEDEMKTGTNEGAVDVWLRNLNESDRRLAMAAIATEEMRAAILRDCNFHCSAGIAHNKLLAKLVCSRHKPDKQTVLPQSAVDMLFRTTPVHQIRLLGGKLGTEVTLQLGVEFVAELVQFSEKQLQLEFGEKQGSWLYQVCRGVDNEPVKSRRLAKSIGCGKNFAVTELLDTEEKVKHWLRMMSLELEERLAKDKHKNHREAHLLTMQVRFEAGLPSVEGSKSCPILRYTADKLYADSVLLLHKFQQPRDSASGLQTRSPAIRSLYVSASKFEDIQSKTSSIKQFVFKTQSFPTHGSSASAVKSSDPLCISSASAVKSSDPLGISSTRAVKSSDPMCISSASTVKSSDPLCLSCASVVKLSNPLHRSYATVVRSSDATHGSSASLSRSSDTISGPSFGLRSESSAPLSASSASVVTSSDLMHGSLPSMQGSCLEKKESSTDVNKSFFTASTLEAHKPETKSHVSSDVQPQLHTVSDDGGPIDVPEDDSHPSERHNSGWCLGLPDDSSYLGQTLSVNTLCPAEGPQCDSRCMLRKTDTDKPKETHVTAQCKINDTVVGGDSAKVSVVTSENGSAEGPCISDTIQCHKCGVSVNVWETQEHSDFHLAVDLQEKETSKSDGKRKSTDGTPHRTKRKKSLQNVTTLHRFFETT